MKKLNLVTCALLLSFAASIVVVSCNKEEAPTQRLVTPVFPPAPPASFVEEFDSAGTLTRKGWVFKNNSYPIGTTGWRQGRYESASMAQYKFLAPVPFIGFPAYSASTTPNDFISCDASAVNDAATGTGDISAWLISPMVPIKNGDQIIFYTRAVNDANYPIYTKDRMQVRANFSNGTVNVGGSPTSVGNFNTLLLDINPQYLNNDPAGNTPAAPGYPQDWTKYTINITGIPGTGAVPAARFAFRYLAADAGLFGGSSGNYPTVVGLDSLAFIHN
ncbi:hypothetical protein EXU57_12980 [Segetibacter sp. 3557_3]|uniref:choice-of-anchor J domain-containing protein n=1 Tax=Segetibacter sp. 3557_3 TaxID=2547429 RepID=UPI0010583D02|nr:choice-of-anchor J domain-containing protein [Segetibacter sp. 3557_3]TDH25612.1 hypothetical protein EXU57_12980 [Segetibacter sp. 3557_3]